MEENPFLYISQKRIQVCLNNPVESGLVVCKKASTLLHPFTTIDLLCVGSLKEHILHMERRVQKKNKMCSSERKQLRLPNYIG